MSIETKVWDESTSAWAGGGGKPIVELITNGNTTLTDSQLTNIINTYQFIYFEYVDSLYGEHGGSTFLSTILSNFLGSSSSNRVIKIAANTIMQCFNKDGNSSTSKLANHWTLYGIKF